MLRLDEDFTDFHARCLNSETHRSAAHMHFGRLLRSASLFEDMVKVICTCNVTWRQTVTMIDNLVRHWGVPAGGPAQDKGFPTAAALSRVGVEELQHKARLGYRAAFVHRLALATAQGDLDLNRFACYPESTAQLMKELRAIHGVGEYAAAHIAMLLGRYDRLAIDTEMIRLLETRYPRRRWTRAAIHRHYEQWDPYQFLAYWFELWQDYVRRHGRSDLWDRSITGMSITSDPIQPNLEEA
jgi:3-methyladenine DNA glycosylase/8-oxoguanine DNA glycosylase